MDIKDKTKAFEIVKRIVGEKETIMCNDYGKYFIISTTNKPYWICRISSNDGLNTISFPVDKYNGEAHVNFKSVNEILNYSNYIIRAFNTALTF